MRMQMIFFLGTFALILVGAHVLLYGGMVHFFPSLGARARGVLAVVLLLLSASFVVASTLVHQNETEGTRMFYYLSGFWLGMLTNLLLLLVVAWVVSWVTPWFGVGLSRPLLGLLVLVFGLLISLGGTWNAFHPRVREVTVTIPNLPDAWKGKKIVQLTDVHLGAVYRAEWLEKVVGQVNAVKPEAVLITGDLFDGMDGFLEDLAKPLDDLVAPQGVYFITGNHETYLGVQEVLQVLSKTKVHPLENKVVDLQGLKVVGLAYPERGTAQDAPVRALDSLESQYIGRANILMYHSPTHIAEFKDRGINLQLSGHTHKGQQYPFGLITALVYKGYDYGLYKMGDYTLYTSNGVGTWGPAMRVGNVPEIVSITLE